MKRIVKLLVIMLFLIFMILVCNSCHKVAGNMIYSNLIPETHLSDGIIHTYDCYDFVINMENKSITRQNADNNHSPIIAIGGDAPRYGGVSADEGYEGIVDKIEALNDLNTNTSVYYAEVYQIDNSIIGICNVYYDTVGYLSGGGNYGEEEIAKGVLFQYDVDSDNLTIIKTITEGQIVAFSTNDIVFWKDKNLYNLNLLNDEVTFICKDYSYDSGIQHQSFGIIYFNSNFVLFTFVKSHFASEDYYAFIYDFSTHTLTEYSYE